MKKFVSKTLTKANLRLAICKFAKEMGVNKVLFNNNAKKVKGTYNAVSKNMYLDNTLTKVDMLRTFFHELGHHSAVLKNKWKTYHFRLVSEMYIDTIFNIENKIDRIGEKLWYKYVDTKQWGRYKYCYPKSQKKQIVTFLQNS